MEIGCPSYDRSTLETQADGRGARLAGQPVYPRMGGARAAARTPRDASLYFSSNHISSRFGVRLRELRRERRLTQLRMSEDCGIDRSFLSDIERGRKSVSLPFLKIIAVRMQISMSEMVKDL